jgi:hypothetical protein
MARLCCKPGFSAVAAPGLVMALSITKSLVEKMRAGIYLHSERGQGRIFLSGVATFPDPANVAAALGPVV